MNSRNQPQQQQNPSSQMFTNQQQQLINQNNVNSRTNSPNPYLRNQNSFNNNLSVTGNTIVQGQQQQQQMYQGMASQEKIIQPNNLNRLMNNAVQGGQSNLNSALIPQPKQIHNLPISSVNGFLGPQKVIVPGLINLPPVQSQPINQQKIQPVPHPVEKMCS